MKRRELLRVLTLTTGTAVAIPLSATFLAGCKKVKKVNDAEYTLHFFDKDEFALVQRLMDVILPKTDSPSATEVGVHQIMDTMIEQSYSPELRKAFVDKFTALKSYLTDDDLSDQVNALLQSNDEKSKTAKDGLLDIKQQVVAYYLNTEEVATNYLHYVPVPGEYEACISLESVGGKAWAI